MPLTKSAMNSVANSWSSKRKNEQFKGVSEFKGSDDLFEVSEANKMQEKT
jgi:hypothetical protein